MNQPLRSVRVLLIDDDEDTRELYALALEQAGAEVRAVGDAKGAMQTALDWPPHVIVSDLAMPESDGHSLLRELRTVRHLPGIPAIAVTGSTSAEDREGALAAGFQEHAAKPLGPDELIGIVTRWASTAPCSGAPSAQAIAFKD